MDKYVKAITENIRSIIIFMVTIPRAITVIDFLINVGENSARKNETLIPNDILNLYYLPSYDGLTNFVPLTYSNFLIVQFNTMKTLLYIIFTNARVDKTSKTIFDNLLKAIKDKKYMDMNVTSTDSEQEIIPDFDTRLSDFRSYVFELKRNGIPQYQQIGTVIPPDKQIINPTSKPVPSPDESASSSDGSASS